MFASIDFSKLWSLIVFGEWRSFFISEKIELLRVLDLEDASGRRLKFLCQGCGDVSRLPDSLGSLKQLQTLDIRDTAICKLPKSIVEDKEAAIHIRASSMAETKRSLPSPAECSWLPKLAMSMCRQLLATHTRTVSTCVSKMSLSLHLQGEGQQKQPAGYTSTGRYDPRGQRRVGVKI